MGACYQTRDDLNYRNHHRRIDYDNDAHIHRVLLLGPGASGKSTLRKNIKNQYDDICNHDIIIMTQYIQYNCISAINQLLDASELLYNSYNIMDCGIDEKHQELSDMIMQIRNSKYIDLLDVNQNELKELGESIEKIWNLHAIQQTFKHRFKKIFVMDDNIEYFLNKVTEIMDTNYIPNNEDDIKCVNSTRGWYEQNVQFKDDIFQIMDVGGGQNERRKWIHLANQECSCIVYCCALNQYCLAMKEYYNWSAYNNDYISAYKEYIGLPALIDSIDLFHHLINWKGFKYIPIIILFTKIDLYRESLKNVSLQFCFGDNYKGRNYNDYDKYNVYFMKIIMNEIENDINIHIPDEIGDLIGLYFGVKDIFWLQLCYQDGIKWMKQLFNTLSQNDLRTLVFHEINALHAESLDDLLKQIQIVCRKEL